MASCHAFSMTRATSSTSSSLSSSLQHFIGIDLGTSGCRISVLQRTQESLSNDKTTTTMTTAATQQQQEEVYTKAILWNDNNNNNNSSNSSSSYDDPEGWVRAVHSLIRDAVHEVTALQSSTTTTAICISGTSASCVLMDQQTGAATRRGAAATAARMYNYTVSDPHVLQQLQRYAPRKHTASSPTGSLAKLLEWHAQQPLQKHEVLAHQADFVLAHLLEKNNDPNDNNNKNNNNNNNNNHYQVVSDWHNCLKLGYDVRTLTWPSWLTTALFQAQGLLPNVLPRHVYSPGQVVGNVDATVVASWGMDPSSSTTQLVAGTTDSNAAFIAAAVAGTTSSSTSTVRGVVGTAVTSLGSTLALKLLSHVYVEDATYGVYSHRFPNVLLDNPATNTNHTIKTKKKKKNDEYDNNDNNMNASSPNDNHTNDNTANDDDSDDQVWLVGGASNVGCAIFRQLHFSNAELKQLSAGMNPWQHSPYEYYPLTRRGERFPESDPYKQAVLEPVPESRMEFLHGLLQGIASVEVQGFAVLHQLGAPWPTHVWTSGGGAQNDAWIQMRQDRLAKHIAASSGGGEGGGGGASSGSAVTVSAATHTEASYGAALLAAASFVSKPAQT